MSSGAARTLRPSRDERPRDLSRPLPAALSWTVLGAFGVAFALAIVVIDLPLWMPLLCGAASLVAFGAYALDKAAAKRNRRRIPEQTLLVIGLIGGWPGALIAQQLLRHKTRKRSFRRRFWLTVVLNVAVLAVLASLAATMPGALDLPAPAPLI